MPVKPKPRPKVIVVMPAYNAAKTVERTYNDIPKAWVDEVILVDDVSKDETVEVARRLPIHVVVHRENKGYGGNQKTCYTEALMAGAEVVVMLHPDYQYDSRLIPQMVSPILDGHADFVMGSRIIGEGALKGGMPWWKFVANRLLTMAENIILNRKFSDLHTGFRAYSRRLLMDVPYVLNSDDFVFDSQMIAQANYRGYTTTEVPIPTRYFNEASSVSFKTSTIYGVKTVWVMGKLALQKLGLARYQWLEAKLEDVIGRDYKERIFGDAKGGKSSRPMKALQILALVLLAARTWGQAVPVRLPGSLVAGSGEVGARDGDFLHASFGAPSGIACLEGRNLLVVADRGANALRTVDLAHDDKVATLCGGTEGDQDGQGGGVQLRNPTELVVGPGDNSVLFLDQGGRALKRADLNGAVHTLARDPQGAWTGLALGPGGSVLLMTGAAGRIDLLNDGVGSIQKIRGR